MFNKIKNQKNMKKMIILVLILLIGLPVFVNANMYDTLQSLELRNCNLINEKEINDPQLDDLVLRFGLQEFGDNNCSFVVDSYPYGPLAQEFIGVSPEISELDYVINWDEEYLFLLTNEENEGTLYPPLFELLFNYQNYEPFLNKFRNWVPVHEEADFDIYTPVPNNCVSGGGNLYVGNSISYTNLSGQVVIENSLCFNDNLLFYPYCENQTSSFLSQECNCNVDRCIASFNEVLYFGFFYDRMSPRGLLIDEDFFDSAIKSWIWDGI
jgi:hypothetical protein